ncbi:M16 family metallopeptidase [Microscilla marina]|uniref:Putative zinc protease n=1 Tax=Microscilla marina ATCC 23134 TaxID=313606 RepID=A1ZSQ3_MICM2|nr:M16 family metallopeptidase [Microscilla marina]EAY26633.1 putative zinc protease [Microscilla marina ATCC 23134]
MNYKLITQGMMLCLLAVVVAGQTSFAQQLDKKIPFDAQVRTGKLKNGLKYYIRKNAKPEKRVELRLAVNAGSMQENDNQQGLAHFVEHMAFNGTKNFKKNELVSYLQSAGVKFGAHLNAYTSFDETVYMLRLPTDKQEVMDKGFQILEDWAHNVSFDNKEIDKERGVVIEEWRLGRGAGQRMRDQYFPVLLNDSRYAKRLPIGKKKILENFKYNTLKQFYKDWYRPDLMAVVVVGDIDLDAMEKKIKQHFSRLKPVKNVREKKLYPVPPHQKTFVSINTDKEAPFSQVQIIYKKPLKKVKNLTDYRQQIINRFHSGMLNQRLRELTEKADPPFINAGFYYGSFIRSIDAYSGSVLANGDDILGGLRVALTESKRVRKHGFTKGEFERYKKTILNSYKRAYNERKKTDSKSFAREYVAHFLQKEPTPGVKFEYEFVKKVLPTITLAEVNALSKKWITKDNRVIIINAPEKKGVIVPTEAQVRTVLKEVAFNAVKPYKDKAVGTKLMDKMPTAGKVTNTKTYPKSGTTELTLSNGIVVTLKPTDFKDDQVLFNGYSLGGYSLAAAKNHVSAIYASQIIVASGVSKFKAADLRKMMAGKSVSVKPYIREVTHGVSGATTPQDLETALQMTHLYFTQPRKDETAFKSMKNQYKSMMQNLMANPNFYFQDQLTKIKNQNHPRAAGFFPTKEELEKIDLDQTMAFYKRIFSNGQNFKFVFVGNFKVDKIKPLLEKYIGSLPTTQQKATFKDLGIRPPKGKVTKKLYKGKDPKSQVHLSFMGAAKYSTKDASLIKALAEALSIKLIEKLREEKGGVYGAGAYSYMQKKPYDNYAIVVSFPCAPNNVDDLVTATMGEIKKIQKSGISSKDLKKVQAQQIRSMETNMKNNRYWLNTLRSAYVNEKDREKITEYEQSIQALNSKDMQKAAQKYFDMKNYIKVVLYPETMKK